MTSRKRPRTNEATQGWRYPWLAVCFVFVAISGVGLIAAGDRSGIFYTILGLVGIGQAWVIGHPDRSKPPALFVAKFGVPLTILAFLTTL